MFDGHQVPSIFQAYSESFIATSYSKDLSIPGERIGFAAVHPEAADCDELLAGMAICNRTLGFVNAPATPQQIIRRTSGIHVEAGEYERRRDLLCQGLREAGYRFTRPEGAFYLFPESPVPEEIPFVHELLEEGVLVVPGTGFGRSGYFRIAYCVEEKVIENALPAFDRVLRRHRIG